MKQVKTSEKILAGIDLVIFSILAVVFEVINNNYIEKKGVIFYLSFSMTLSIIMMIRWGLVGSMIYVVSGIAIMCVRVGSFQADSIYYIVANVFFAIPMLIYGKRDRNQLVNNPLKFLGFIIASYACLCVGKGLALYVLYHNVCGIADYLGTTMFTLFINIIACFILRMRKELLCDMTNCFVEKGEDYEQKD